jgi:predicted DNA-binding ribbon-helix-helix protein
MITKRSIAINGTVTSISLEPGFWEELERRAVLNQYSWQDYLRKMLENAPDTANRSTKIRVGLLNMLKDDLFRMRNQHKESWWTVKSDSGIQEIGTRGFRLFAGRDAANDIVIDDAEVSCRHLMLCWDLANWWIVDLESKNGTIVKGKQTNVAKITAQSTIRVGNSSILLMD